MMNGICGCLSSNIASSLSSMLYDSSWLLATVSWSWKMFVHSNSLAYRFVLVLFVKPLAEFSILSGSPSQANANCVTKVSPSFVSHMVFSAAHVSSHTDAIRTCSRPKQNVGIASPTHSSVQQSGYSLASCPMRIEMDRWFSRSSGVCSIIMAMEMTLRKSSVVPAIISSM